GGEDGPGQGEADDEASEGVREDATDDESTSGSGSGSSGGSRRTRSRGRTQGAGTSRPSAGDADSADGDGPEGSGSGEDPDGAGKRTRRPRRRSRSGQTERTAQDEVTSVKGSTRLEAKRQRRREGREAGRRRTVITEAEFLARRESVDRVMVGRGLEDRKQ